MFRRILSLKLPQPCAAFDGCRCRIYSQRPKHCRQFECILLKKLNQKKIRRATATRIIGKVREVVEETERLLTRLGDEEDKTPLRARFQRLSKKLHMATLHPREAAVYAELTLAMHQLDVLLSEHFYR